MINIICLYKNKYDEEVIEKRFDNVEDYNLFGIWIANNAVDVEILDVIIEE